MNPVVREGHRSIKVCIFCGSRDGNDPSFLKAAVTTARELASHGFGLVYGGASIGLMGAVADAFLEQNLGVTGVIPRILLEKEVAHRGVPDLRIVASMHERKQLMYDLSEAFVVLPGGFGTLDELFEVVTWIQIGMHSKPVFVLNWSGYYSHLLAHIDSCVESGFIQRQHRNYLKVYDTPSKLGGELVSYFKKNS